MKKLFLASLILALLLLPGLALGEGADELTLKVSLSAATVDVSRGEGITATLEASGGTAPYVYTQTDLR
ncbi:MAG: hypothetical protein AB9880_08265 [Christensenellales bacterium]